MKCPVCGYDAEILFLVHCSNPECQNYSKSSTIVDSTVQSRYPTIKNGDWVRFRTLTRVEMICLEEQALKENSDFYKNEIHCGVNSDMEQWMDGNYYEVDYVESCGHKFFLVADNNWVWSAAWVEYVKEKQ